MSKTRIRIGTHKDVEVYFEGKQFTATMGAQRFAGPSWDSITDKITKAAGFIPVMACYQDGKGVKTVRLVGREKMFSSNSYKFVREDGETVRYESFYDAKAEPILRERMRLSAEMDRIKQEYLDKIGKCDEKLNPLRLKANADD